MIRHAMRILTRAFSVVTAVTPSVTWASPARPSVFPWDRPLNLVAAYMAGPIVHAFLIGSFLAAAVLYALGGSEAAARFFKAAVGAAISVCAVQLLNYLLP